MMQGICRKTWCSQATTLADSVVLRISFWWKSGICFVFSISVSRHGFELSWFLDVLTCKNTWNFNLQFPQSTCIAETQLMSLITSLNWIHSNQGILLYKNLYNIIYITIKETSFNQIVKNRILLLPETES